MKVLHIINSLEIGGAETLLANSLAKGGLQENVDNVIVCFKGDSILLDKIDKKVEIINLDYKGKYSILALLKKIRKVIKSQKPDIIHTHLNPAGWYTALMRPSNIPQVHTIHIAYSYDKDTSKTRLFFERIFQLQRKNVNLITLSPLLKDDLIASVKIKGQVYVLPNFVDDVFFAENPKQQQPDKKLKLVAVGNIRPQKNYAYLLDIFRHLKGQDVSVDVYGFGDHTLFSKIVEKENLGIKFMGPSLNLKETYPQYDGFIMPSKFEGFPLSLFEAMASGIPLLLADIAPLKSIVKDNAIYFGLDNAEKAAEIIKNALNNNSSLQAMSAKAKVYAEETVRREIYIKKLIAIYNEIITK